MAKRNNKGFSFIEMIVVVAILAVSVTVAGGAFLSAYRARSNKAANTIDSMIAQSKINAMSGKKNCLIIGYNESGKCYDCGLYALDESGNPVSPAYEFQDVGNEHLQITCGGVNLMDSGSQLRLDYSMDTGKVKSLTVGDVTVLGPGSAATSTDITLSFYSSHTIKIYKTTGEHIVDG